MHAFLRLFLKFYLGIRHTDEMCSILEVSSEQLQELYEKNKKIIIFPLTKGDYGDIFVYRRC